jgi:glycerol uptake facilitator-like aquaporin
VSVFDLGPQLAASRQLRINALWKTAVNYWYLPAAGQILLAASGCLLGRLFRRWAASS